MLASDRHRLVDAFQFALEAHGDQIRKGSKTPYASHLIQVAGMVLENDGDATQAVAALLHDALEDCEAVDEPSLRSRFGDEVADIVVACSDLLPGDTPKSKSPWDERKRRYLARIEGADLRVQLVAACDKLHNLRSLIGDLRADGRETLSRFNATPEQTRWYYERARQAAGGALCEAARCEFDELLVALRAFVPGNP